MQRNRSYKQYQVAVRNWNSSVITIRLHIDVKHDNKQIQNFHGSKPHTSHQCRVGRGRTVADCSCPFPLHPLFRRWIAYSHRLFPLSMSLGMIPQPFLPGFDS